MKWRGILLVASFLLVFCGVSKANITNVWYADDGDGAVVCNATNWWGSAKSITLCIDGVQNWAPGHVLGTVLTDSSTDPTLTISTTDSNAMGFAWTSYEVNVYVTTNFTISNVQVTFSPSNDWTVLSGPTTPTLSTNGMWVSSFVLDTGTPIANGSELGFKYDLGFSGSTFYGFTQEMNPVPEPGTLALVALGGLVFGGFRMARRSRRT